MAGHSKWANIKHRKAAQDSKRSAQFTKVIREITVAAKEGGPDPETNPRLRLAIQKAKEVNLPKDKVQTALDKATGAGADDLQEVLYEGYGPNGVAFMVECTTENINRTVASVRSYFTRAGGSLGVSGSVAFMFERKGVFFIAAEGRDEEELMLELIDAGAEDIEQEDGKFVITCAFEHYGAVASKLDEMGIEPEQSELVRVPQNYVPLGPDDAAKILKLVDTFEDDDDVAKVFHNLEMSEEVVALMDA